MSLITTFSATDRVLVYRTTVTDRGIHVFDRTGRSMARVGPTAQFGALSLSRDGRRAAIVVEDPKPLHTDIWTMDLARNVLTRLTVDAGNHRAPIWSPDGKWIAYTKGRAGMFRIRSTGGSLPEEIWPSGDRPVGPTDWSPDGRFMIVNRLRKDRMDFHDIIAVSLDGHRTMLTLVQSWDENFMGQISPDGHWLAFVSNDSGRFEVYVQAFPLPRGRWQVSTAGGAQPRWGHNGRELLYLTPDQTLMVATFRPDGPQLGVPQPLFRLRLARSCGGFWATPIVCAGFQFDVMPRDDRIIAAVTSPAAEVQETRMAQVLNWADGQQP